MASPPRRRILVVNPNSNEVVTSQLADALAPVAFTDGPAIDCVTLKEGPYGIETQEHVQSVTLPLRRLVAGNNDFEAFVIACYSDPGLHAAREVTTKPVLGSSLVMRFYAGLAKKCGYAASRFYRSVRIDGLPGFVSVGEDGVPQTTALALALGGIVSQSVLVEVVFGYPGIGTLLYRAISGFDFFLIYGIVFLVIVTYWPWLTLVVQQMMGML